MIKKKIKNKKIKLTINFGKNLVLIYFKACALFILVCLTSFVALIIPFYRILGQKGKISVYFEVDMSKPVLRFDF